MSVMLRYSVDMNMYKSNDFRCLKPKKGVPYEKWPHYEMTGYRQTCKQYLTIFIRNSTTSTI